MRALGFCVSVDHAHFMARKFTEAGIPSQAVSGDTPRADRERALLEMRTGSINALFAADLFNEGLDLPAVDTVLFLRPTESATIFLQQLGRGLRRTPDKAVLTVLDFVGHHRKEFRFDMKLRALTGQTRRGLQREIQRGFPFLPSGCQIVMDKQSQSIVLENIRSQMANRWPRSWRNSGHMAIRTYPPFSGSPASSFRMCFVMVAHGLDCGEKRAYPREAGVNLNRAFSSARGRSRTSTIGPAQIFIVGLFLTAHLTTKACRLWISGWPRCCSSRCGRMVGAAVVSRWIGRAPGRAGK